MLSLSWIFKINNYISYFFPGHHQGTKRPEYPQDAWYNVQKDTKKAACRHDGQGGKAAADDLAGKRIFKRVRTDG